MAEHSTHATQRRYPPELRERPVRMVLETASERGERFGAVSRLRRLLRAGSIVGGAFLFGFQLREGRGYRPPVRA